MKACPRCKSLSKYRIRRKGIIRLIPGTRTYVCDICSKRYAWFSFINRSLKI